MAQDSAIQFMALCAVLSFFYISVSLERHSLTESPRLSSFLVFLLSGSICYASSFFTKWLPGADGRFTTNRRQGLEAALFEASADKDSLPGAHGQMPMRPRRWSLPVVVMCVVLRLEIFHRVNYQQQCSTPGTESFLCLLLFAYEVFATRRRWGFPTPENPDDPWRSFLDDLKDWFSGPRVTLTMVLMSTTMIAVGTFFAVGQIARSTYFCFTLVESRRMTLLLQILGLVLDAATIILLWRLLAWARTWKLRLQTMGSVFVFASIIMNLIWVAGKLYKHDRMLHPSFGSLYAFDIVVDSIAFAALMISAAFWVCETSLLTPACVTTFLVGTVSSWGNIIDYGDWLHLSRSQALTPLCIIAFGMIWFSYSHALRTVIFVHRVVLAVLLLLLLMSGLFTLAVKQTPYYEKRHPINDFIYQAHVKHDQWLRKATQSTNIKVAVDVYKERHEGRDPPPGFADWYKFAQGTAILDQFDQIKQDLDPFRRLSPKDLRDRALQMAEVPGVQVVEIKNGRASQRLPPDEEDAKILEDLVAILNRFAKVLPDMILPINLSPTPRVLPSWERANWNRAHISSVADLLTKRSGDGLNGTAALSIRGEEASASPSDLGWRYISAADYRQMQVDACPAGSRMRTSPHWSIGEFCSACVRPHSRGQLLTNWDKSLQWCSQPDLKYLHGMSLTNPSMPPVQQLMPLFGSSKTDAFSDILIPLPAGKEPDPDIKRNFETRYDTLFWRGPMGEHAISEQALHGNHKLRLLHLINNPNPGDEISMLFPTDSGNTFGFEKVLAADMDKALPFSMGINDYSSCLGQNCDIVRQAYGTREELQEPLEYRYVLLLDEDDGPPKDLLRTLRSLSVPFVSTVFRTWYTERLMPWMHFVPIDVRYHGLHSTFAYFTGTADRTSIKGPDSNLAARPQDGEWIGQQGLRWAERALGERDMEVYLYRLLLEWGRLVDERRETIGFKIDEKGVPQDDEWTRQEEHAP